MYKYNKKTACRKARRLISFWVLLLFRILLGYRELCGCGLFLGIGLVQDLCGDGVIGAALGAATGNEHGDDGQNQDEGYEVPGGLFKSLPF